MIRGRTSGKKQQHETLPEVYHTTESKLIHAVWNMLYDHMKYHHILKHEFLEITNFKISSKHNIKVAKINGLYLIKLINDIYDVTLESPT